MLGGGSGNAWLAFMWPALCGLAQAIRALAGHGQPAAQLRPRVHLDQNTQLAKSGRGTGAAGAAGGNTATGAAGGGKEPAEKLEKGVLPLPVLPPLAAPPAALAGGGSVHGGGGGSGGNSTEGPLSASGAFSSGDAAAARWGELHLHGSSSSGPAAAGDRGWIQSEGSRRLPVGWARLGRGMCSNCRHRDSMPAAGFCAPNFSATIAPPRTPSAPPVLVLLRLLLSQSLASSEALARRRVAVACVVHDNALLDANTAAGLAQYCENWTNFGLFVVGSFTMVRKAVVGGRWGRRGFVGLVPYGAGRTLTADVLRFLSLYVVSVGRPPRSALRCRVVGPGVWVVPRDAEGPRYGRLCGNLRRRRRVDAVGFREAAWWQQHTVLL